MMKIPVLIFLTFFFNVTLSVAQQFQIEKTDEGISIKQGQENVLFFQAKTKSIDGTYGRANYIHPLYGLDGFVLTEDFPDDHLHHRGVFWTWHRVNIGDTQIGDAWECEDFVWDVTDYNAAQATDSSVMLTAKTLWESPLWLDNQGKQKPFAEENSKITIHAKNDNYRIIDFEISLLALEPGLTIAGSDDSKGYSGFSVRMKMPKDIAFTSENGAVQPKLNQLDAGPWMDVSGTLTSKGGKAGIVIICNSENPVYADPWIIRKSGSMQNPAFPGRLPVLISEKRPLVLRYRLVVYEGELSKELLENLSEAF